MRHFAFGFALLALAGCKEELAGKPAPVEMTAEAVGYYCQMELLDHVGPKGQIHLDGMPAPVFFSQVRDTIAYLHMPEQSHAVRATYVQDMTDSEWTKPGPWIPVEDAHFVIGSDRQGGMDAPEYVPFSDEAAALAFVRRHGGEVRRFDRISATDVLTQEIPDVAFDEDISARLKSLSSERGTN